MNRRFGSGSSALSYSGHSSLANRPIMIRFLIAVLLLSASIVAARSGIDETSILAVDGIGQLTGVAGAGAWTEWSTP
ncbi:hypothetical protein [Oryzibacter oryziterrae]|uniref:hypothetical protein n=1 Tax=Oryzibacter oryziterrae TaxID=2766474 RepID=UPI001F42C0E5|nr:hypothetical protein [Oryzibacter oryziterrae]